MDAKRATCRLCGDATVEAVCDFGAHPVAGYLVGSPEEALAAPRFPLALGRCPACGHVQQANADPRAALEHVYSDYQATYSMSGDVSAYVAGFLATALAAAGVPPGGRVVEVGSNDGSALAHLAGRGYAPVGFEPAGPLVAAARERGMTVVEDYFGEASATAYAAEAGGVPLLFTRHTLEHAFDPGDFLAGIAAVLTDGGLAVVEVPDLWLQLSGGHYETFSAQHVSSFTVGALTRALAAVGLHAERLRYVSMDGGSMVVFARKAPVDPPAEVEAALTLERRRGLDGAAPLEALAAHVAHERAVVGETLAAYDAVAAYGTGSKGQGLLNVLGLGTDVVPVAIDDTPGNAGRYVPGTATRVVAGTSPEADAAGSVLVTAPTHAATILAKEAARQARGVAFYVTVPSFRPAPLAALGA